MGFLSKLREGLGKTRSALMGGIESVMRSFVKIDEDFLEELEEILITSDVGVGASEEIIDELRERIRDDRIKTRDDTMAALREIISGMIGESEPLHLDTKPSVILVIGVNGAGKRPPSVRYRHVSKPRAREWSWLPPTPSVPRR